MKMNWSWFLPVGKGGPNLGGEETLGVGVECSMMDPRGKPVWTGPGRATEHLHRKQEVEPTAIL